MGSNPNGGVPCVDGAPCNLYALVIYLPDPLARYLDDLRLQLVPGCSPHAHVSVLPPRPLSESPAQAIEQTRQVVAAFPPFDVELGEIEVFPVTDVIYIRVESGAEQLRQMHKALNRGALGYAEPFPYHPHITLAQELAPGRMQPLLEIASRRWREFPGPRKFRAEHTVFVQHACGNEWIDLAEEALRAVPAIP